MSKGEMGLAARLAAARLTSRELQVFRKIVEGKANKAIAHDLGCATKTIELHVSNLFRKVGVKSRLELACKVLGPTETAAAP